MAEMRLSLIDELTPTLRRLARECPHSMDVAAVRIATAVQRQAKINVKQKLNTSGRSTGNLGRGITVIGRPGTGSAQVGPQAVYGAQKEFGGEIRPVRAKALVFELPDGTLVITQRVYQEPRPYLRPALETIRPQAPAIVEDELKRLID